jgi:signal transduction histidine kinase
VLPRIFQPFFTSKKRRGLGLGLPICDRIVKAHGGRIEVESASNKGTTFTIRLPINGSADTSVGQEAII